LVSREALWPRASAPSSVASATGVESGWNQRWAINVGTTALPITAVNRMVY
jgi:hypothetical protein